MIFTERIKDLRLNNNFTQSHVAQSCSMTERHYQRLEAGATPKAEILVSIADFYNVSLDYLMGRTDNPEVNR